MSQTFEALVSRGEKRRSSSDSQGTVRAGRLPSSISSGGSDSSSFSSSSSEDDREHGWVHYVNTKTDSSNKNSRVVLGELYNYIFKLPTRDDETAGPPYDGLEDVRQNEINPLAFREHYVVGDSDKLYFLPANVKLRNYWTPLLPGTYCYAAFQDRTDLHEELTAHFWYLPAGWFYIPPDSTNQKPTHFLPEGYVKVTWHTPPDHVITFLQQSSKDNLLQSYDTFYKDIKHNLALDENNKIMEIGGVHHSTSDIQHNGPTPWSLQSNIAGYGYYCPIKTVPEDANYNFGQWYRVTPGSWHPTDSDPMYPASQQIDSFNKVMFFNGALFSNTPGSWYKVPAGFFLPSESKWTDKSIVSLAVAQRWQEQQEEREKEARKKKRKKQSAKIRSESRGGR